MKHDVSFKEKCPWPERGDELFTSQGNPHLNACLNFTHDKLNLYATGYRTAAQLLVSYVQDHGYHIDTLVYPIVFLYRHYLELRLKELIREGRRLIDHAEPFPKKHYLDYLWRLCRQVIEKALPEESKNQEVLEIMDEYIKQFAELDDESFAFRYPMKKDESPSLPENLRHINIEQFSRAMERVANFLDAASTAISVYSGYKAEMDAECAEYVAEMEAEYAAEMRSIEAEIEKELQAYYDGCQ